MRKIESFQMKKIYAIGHALGIRSEEHTSELQSHVRIAYAVFCLKKEQNTYKPWLKV